MNLEIEDRSGPNIVVGMAQQEPHSWTKWLAFGLELTWTLKRGDVYYRSLKSGAI